MHAHTYVRMIEALPIPLSRIYASRSIGERSDLHARTLRARAKSDLEERKSADIVLPALLDHDLFPTDDVTHN